MTHFSVRNFSINVLMGLTFFPEFNSEEWSDSDDDETVSDPARRIAALEKKLTRAKQEFDEYRSVISQRLNISTLMEDAGPSAPIPNARDDDTHYFQSYGENGSSLRTLQSFLY